MLGGNPRTFNPFNYKRAREFVELSFDVGVNDAAKARAALGKHPDLITESLTKKLKAWVAVECEEWERERGLTGTTRS